MGKIHELIAVDKDLKARANQALREVSALFAAGDAVFEGQVRTYEPLDEKGETFPAEIKPLGAGVAEQIKRLRADYGRWIDLAVSTEASNSLPEASASVVVDGVEVLPNLPVTALLNLESKLEALRTVYQAIPVNGITSTWVWDTANNLWRASAVESYRTRKVNQRFVRAEATERHPAQVDVVQVDERAGRWITTKTSGMLSPAQKAERLARLDNLLLAVRRARQRANEVEAADLHVAGKIFDFIEGGVTP